MRDHFAVLGLPRAVCVDADALKGQFQRLAAAAHPDAGGTAERFAEVNAAWQALRTPAGCLRHFVELEHPAALAEARGTPAELGGLFMEIGALAQEAREVAQWLDAASSPVARALVEPRRLAVAAKARALAETVEKETTAVLAGAQSAPRDGARLAAALSRLVFLEKWAGQLREFSA